MCRPGVKRRTRWYAVQVEIGIALPVFSLAATPYTELGRWWRGGARDKGHDVLGGARWW